MKVVGWGDRGDRHALSTSKYVKGRTVLGPHEVERESRRSSEPRGAFSTLWWWSFSGNWCERGEALH